MLYTRAYTQKVWTVYEMACFLCVHPKGHLVWLPVSLPPVVFVGSFAVWLWCVTSWAMRLTVVLDMISVPHVLFYAVTVPGVLAITHMFRNAAREQAQSHEDLRSFSNQGGSVHCGERPRCGGGQCGVSHEESRVCSQ